MRHVVIASLFVLATSIACSSDDNDSNTGLGGGSARGGAGGRGGAAGSAAPGGSGGQTTNNGVSGSGGSGEDQEVRGPTPPQDGANFPFPQNRESEHCTYPTANRNRHVTAAYEKWKRDTVTADGAKGALRVKRPNEPGLEPNSTVSEGIAYGMLIAVYMNDQELFDQLWKYEQQWLDKNGLMHWYINAAGTAVLGENAATDADEDMAWALLMADKQWGGGGTLSQSYLEIAKDLIGKIWQHEVQDGKALKPGDSWGGWDTLNISYFAPSYYRLFAKVTGNQGWLDVVETSYDIIDNSLKSEYGNTTNGLVPAWCSSEGVLVKDPKNYQFDSCRTPFRIALDYCQYGEPRAKAYLQKTSNFFSQIGAANIVAGYELNGTPKPEPKMETPGMSAAFIGPAAVGAMSAASYQPFIDEAYERVATKDLYIGGLYYESSWTVLSLLMMTGNFLDYTQYGN